MIFDVLPWKHRMKFKPLLIHEDLHVYVCMLLLLLLREGWSRENLHPRWIAKCGWEFIIEKVSNRYTKRHIYMELTSTFARAVRDIRTANSSIILVFDVYFPFRALYVPWRP